MSLAYQTTKQIKQALVGVIGTSKGVSVRERKWRRHYATVMKGRYGGSNKRLVTIRLGAEAATAAQLKDTLLRSMGFSFFFYGLLNKSGTKWKLVTSGRAYLRS